MIESTLKLCQAAEAGADETAKLLAARLRIMLEVWPGIEELHAARQALDYSFAHMDKANDAEACRLLREANRRGWCALYYLAGRIEAAEAKARTP